MQSVWEQGVKPSGFKRLESDKKTDVLIIGGGMAGLLCAYMLEREGKDYMLCEAQTICGGITKNTTAKLTAQHGLIYDKLISKFGTARARLYLEANETALGHYRELCRSIDCDFEERDNYIYSLYDRHAIEKEAAALQKLGGAAELADGLALPFRVAGAVKLKSQAQFNPLKFAAAISRGLNIYEHTCVRELRGKTALTDGGSIRSEKIIVATHFPFINKHGCYFIKMYQHRSYVIALEGAQEIDGMYLDEAEGGLSFRNYGSLLLLGGGGHRTGKKGGGWQELRDFAARHYPQARERFHWAAQDCITLDGVPYIGKYSQGADGLFVATGFNKWGMTGSMVAAKLLCNLLEGRESPYEELFSPSRSILRPQLAVNSLETAVNLLTPTTPRCPHLGCALKWNRAEQSWDCPCHGSRFTRNGELLDNPATGSLN